MPERHDGRRRVDPQLDPQRTLLATRTLEPTLELAGWQDVDRVRGQELGIGHA
jgi:hypothetical protein